MPPDAGFKQPAHGETMTKHGKALTEDDVAAVVGTKSLSRATQNRPDDSEQSQIKVWYVLPSDGFDESLDTNGAISRSVSVGLNWLRLQTAGRTFRVDTFNGDLDIGFFRMAKTNAEIAATGAYVRDEIEAAMDAAGLTELNHVDLVYYGGSSSYACGGGAYPPTLVGTIGALYLKGEVPGYVPCSANQLASTATAPPGYWEYSWVHEMMHVMGFVAPCAPHHALNGHVDDTPIDLMYAGTEPWRPSTLDVNHDDYFDHGRVVCADLALSTYLKSADQAFAVVQAVEYFHEEWGHYFVTAIPQEISALDAGLIPPWKRTGFEFNVYPVEIAPAGAVPVCRFFTDQAFAPVSSHFYTPFARECEGVMQNKSWFFEGLVFSVVPATVVQGDGACPANTIKVYRMYNNGQSGAPNHRYMTQVHVTDEMFSQGWCDEGFGSPPPGSGGNCSLVHRPGVVFCAPM